MSATKTTGLMPALLAVQAEVGTLPKDATNPHFKSRFTPLDTIVETVGPLLTKNGLVWTTLPGSNAAGVPVLTYRLIHADTGELLEGQMPLMLTKQDPQGMGSAITYARRYSLTAVLNLVADEDDDGNAGSRRVTNGAAQPTAAPAQATEKPASAAQKRLLNAKADEAGMSNAKYANAILRAVDPSCEPREFETDEQASQLVKRMIDRLPAKLVDPVIAEITGKLV